MYATILSPLQGELGSLEEEFFVLNYAFNNKYILVWQEFLIATLWYLELFHQIIRH